MTIYNKKFEFVRWNEQDQKSIKKAEIKKTKLENQGYGLINSYGFINHTLEYKRPDQESEVKHETI